MTYFPFCGLSYEGRTPQTWCVKASLHTESNFLHYQNLFYRFLVFFSATFLINHADVSFHKFCALCANILDKLVLGSFRPITNTVRVGQNPVNHLYIHHTIPHISVEPSQPLSTTSSPRCFKSSPSPVPRWRRFVLNIFICYSLVTRRPTVWLSYMCMCKYPNATLMLLW